MRAGTERIIGSAAHTIGKICSFGVAGDHFSRWSPDRPFDLAADFDDTGPAESLSANADTIADGLEIGFNQIETFGIAIDNDRAGQVGSQTSGWS